MKIKCTDCPKMIDEDEVIWATEKGKLDTDKGNPYCDECLPMTCPKCAGTGIYLYENLEHESRPYFEDECNECENGVIR